MTKISWELELRVVHVVSGVDDTANGMVVVARLIAKEQGDAEVVDLNHGIHRIHGSDVEEVWVHGMWLPREWAVCSAALKAGKRLVRMTHGSLSPVYLEHQGKWKKRLVGPIERCFLRRCEKIVATCAAEKEWIEAYLGKNCPKVEVTDIRRFFNLSRVEHVERVEKIDGELHVLYLGRRHPLKGVEYLEEAVRQLKVRRPKSEVLFRVVSSAFGEEKEKAWEWCDVLVLPTLSENFGLVVAEALERGKRVITTDGAPAWGEDVGCVEHVESAGDFDGEVLSAYGGRLVYLKGYRDGTKERRIELLKTAIEGCL